MTETTGISKIDLHERSAHVRDGETPNPYVCDQVVCFREGGSTWIWAGTSNITFYKAALGRLVEMGLDPTVWEYSETGKVYDLPYALRITWTRKMSKNGRPYRDITWIERADVDQTELDRAALKMAATAFADDEPDEPQSFALPVAAPAPDLGDVEKRLNELAPLLARAKLDADKTSKAKAEFEKTSAVHQAATNAAASLKKLDKEARDLLVEYRTLTGKQGHVLDDQYTLTSSRPELGLIDPDDLPGFLVYVTRFHPWLLLDFPGFVNLDFKVLDAKLGGKIPPVLESLSHWLTYIQKPGTNINWSNLPLPDTDTEPLPIVKVAESNGHEVGDDKPLPF